MTYYDLTKKDQKKLKNKKPVHRSKKKQTEKKKNKEKLSEYDLRELMGMNVDRFHRVNRRVRRR